MFGITVHSDDESSFYSDISHKPGDHPVMVACWFDGEREVFYGNDSGKMRASIRQYYQDAYGRQPERVIPYLTAGDPPRWDLIDHLAQRIASGQYDNPANLRLAGKKMIDEV